MWCRPQVMWLFSGKENQYSSHKPESGLTGRGGFGWMKIGERIQREKEGIQKKSLLRVEGWTEKEDQRRDWLEKGRVCAVGESSWATQLRLVALPPWEPQDPGRIDLCQNLMGNTPLVTNPWPMRGSRAVTHVGAGRDQWYQNSGQLPTFIALEKANRARKNCWRRNCNWSVG